jgi:hypothetical protein
MQSALLNTISPQLRAVSVDIDGVKQEIATFFYYNGEVTDELFDMASLASTEAVSLSGYFVRDHILRLDFPEQIPVQGRFAFLRKEPNLPDYKKENRAFLLLNGAPPVAVLLLDMQEALLGKVTPALRLVTVGVNSDQKELEFRFIYDGNISEEEFELANSAIREASISFPGYRANTQIERVDSPQNFSANGKRAAYLRRDTPIYLSYKQAVEKGGNPSIFKHKDPEKLVREYAGTGIKYSGGAPGMPGYVEIINFGEFIGYAIERTTGEKVATTWGKIHYAKDGVHIIPTKPREPSL